MSRTINIFLGLILAGVIALGIQRTSVSAQDNAYKIAVVDLQQVGAKYDKRKDKYNELQKQVDTLQAAVDEKRGLIQAARADYEAKRRSLGPEEIAALELKINSDIADYEAALKKGQLKVDSTQALIVSEVMKDIRDAIDKIAEEGNYHLVLNSAKGPTPPVLYAHPSIDITAKVIVLLNQS